MSCRAEEEKESNSQCGVDASLILIATFAVLTLS
jgi:hypothetical protein